MAQLLSQKHFRITDPMINLTMLMVSLPVLICRDPRTMKSADPGQLRPDGRLLRDHLRLQDARDRGRLRHRVMPELWAWLPIFIFLPIAFIELDSMKT